MPTPANRAKIQLVRGSYSNINASLADLVDGELCYAKDENRLYMVEGSTLTPVVAEDDEVLVEVHNQSGSDIAKGKPVYVSGTHSSGKPIVDLTDSNGTNTYPAIGLVYETIANGADGKVIVSGLLSNISTNALGSAGDALYISSTAGGLTITRPTAATEQVQKVGLITRSHASNGSVLVIGAGRTNDVPNEIAVSNLANGTARQLLQTDAAGTGVEFTSNVDVPGTLDVTSAATFDNNVTIEGDLTVNGTTTTIDTTTLIVEDKNIEMGAVSTPTDVTADGGGITLKGTTDKTLTWVDSTDSWTFNQALDLTAGTSTAPALLFNGDVNTGLFQPAADEIAITTAGTQRVTVDSSGHVGIGTDDPLAKLHLYGGDPVLIVQDSDTGLATANSTIRLAESGASAAVDNYWDISAVTSGTSNFGFGVYRNGISAPALFISKTNSSVGIGNDDPQATLDVNGDVLASGNVVIGGSPGLSDGVKLLPSGTVQIARGVNNTIFAGYTTGSNTITAKITGGGNAEFAGKVTSASTGASDSGTTLATKDYVDSSGGGGGATGGGSDEWALEHDNTITTSYTIGSGKNVISAGPLTVNSGATVTVPSGSNWVIA